jgi:hypothetical protein
MIRRTPRRRRATHAISGSIPGRASRRIRTGRVLTAQARIASGHYDWPEVRDMLVDVLLEELQRD